MPAIVTIGIDLAKNVFAVHGVDESGKPIRDWKAAWTRFTIQFGDRFSVN